MIGAVLASQPSWPFIVAHRGASAHRAEHTLAAYALALEQGSDGLECDVRLTRDGHLVCVHDRRIDRTSTGRGVVSAMDYPALAAHEFGSWHDEFPDSADDLVHRRVADPIEPPEHRRLLTLAELLELVVDFPRPVQLFVETKHPVRYSGFVEAKLVALLARYGLARPPSRYDSSVTGDVVLLPGVAPGPGRCPGAAHRAAGARPRRPARGWKEAATLGGHHRALRPRGAGPPGLR